MAKNREFFTSESVTEGHPDKMADQISDSILDAILAKDKNARVACETLVTTGMVHVVGEISTTCYVDIPHIVRETIRDIGYTRVNMVLTATLAASSFPWTNSPRTSLWASTMPWKRKKAIRISSILSALATRA